MATSSTVLLSDEMTRMACEPLGSAGLLCAIARADDLALRDAQTADALRHFLEASDAA